MMYENVHELRDGKEQIYKYVIIVLGIRYGCLGGRGWKGRSYLHTMVHGKYVDLCGLSQCCSHRPSTRHKAREIYTRPKICRNINGKLAPRRIHPPDL